MLCSATARFCILGLFRYTSHRVDRQEAHTSSSPCSCRQRASPKESGSPRMLCSAAARSCIFGLFRHLSGQIDQQVAHGACGAQRRGGRACGIVDPALVAAKHGGEQIFHRILLLLGGAGRASRSGCPAAFGGSRACFLSFDGIIIPQGCCSGMKAALFVSSVVGKDFETGCEGHVKG